MGSGDAPLYRPHELAFRTQYAELKERARATARLLPGTPGSLVKRTGTGRPYWYRVYQSPAGTQVEDWVCKDGDEATLAEARAELEFAQWTAEQVRNLRRLAFQVADKGVAGVLVALYNSNLLTGGLSLVGTLGYMAWLNELGARAVSARTQDVDLAARQDLELAAPKPFLDAMASTRLGFVPVPGMPNDEPSTSVKLPGRDGLRVDMLVHGDRLGTAVPLAALDWHAQAAPHLDYLLAEPREGALLAGGHCIPVQLPQPERLVWHKLFASASRKGFPEKAQKDLHQAATLAAILVEQDDASALATAFGEMPEGMKKLARTRMPALLRASIAHPALQPALQALA